MKTQQITHLLFGSQTALISAVIAMFMLVNTSFQVQAQSGMQLPVEETKEEREAALDCKGLLRAVKEKDNARVRELLNRLGPDCIYRGDGEARSPLVAAARNGDLFIVQLLLDAGADVAFHAEGDEPPLLAAAANGHLEIAKRFVERGAVVNQQLKGEGTALLVASREGQLEMVQYLISQGADVNAQVSGDGTPLINAVRAGHYEVAKVLLEKGADPRLASPGDESPIVHARSQKEKEMVALLLKDEQDN